MDIHFTPPDPFTPLALLGNAPVPAQVLPVFEGPEALSQFELLLSILPGFVDSIRCYA